jgi:CubicO group peptidase (beta-lactamase class C family)
MFIYGGAQWQVAGGVAEMVSGKSWADLIREIYVEPCGLEATAYNNQFSQLPRENNNPFGYPVGFDGDPATLMPTDNPNIEAGLYTTTGDYGKLLLMHLRGGMCDDNRVLSEAAVQAMHADRIAAVYDGSTGRADPSGYGLGWWIFRDIESLIADPGAYGAFPWLDQNRAYGGFLVMEASSGVGSQLFARVYPLATAEIDAALE